VTDVGLTATLVKAGLGIHARAILELARPSVRLDADACPQEELEPGASRFGGIPDLPIDFKWPSYKGLPLAFIGQIDLSAVPAVEGGALPRTGTLAFFYDVESMKWGFDPADRGCSHVAYFEAAVPLRQSRLPAKTAMSTPCELSFTPHIDLPAPGDLVLEEIYNQLTDEHLEAYEAIASALHSDCYHHLLGHPQIVQNDMRLECQLVTNGINMGSAGPEIDAPSAALKPGASDWELLLQLDSDNAPGWMWGDGGRIYFWIRKQDLATRRFENAWLVLQCF
jgi:uncharacterized protein YwqG